MRAIRLSQTFTAQLTDYIDAGEQTYGKRIAADKRARVYRTIRNILATNPAIKRRHRVLGLVIYPITSTPFFVVYDYDDTELRVLFVFIIGKPLDEIDPSKAEW